jgi:UDP-GlcNAc:undecaprenyl-phosphate GlcNAc-1-phosphate transferase
MNDDYVQIAAAIIAAMAALAVGLGARRLGGALGLLDFPDPAGGRKRHSGVTPLVGGIGVLMATVIGGLLALGSDGMEKPVSEHIIWLGAGVLALGAFGLADDRVGLSPRFRLAGGVLILAAMAAAAPDFSISFLRFTGMERLIPLQGWSWVFTLLCLVGLLNAVNMADGKDGLVISLCLLWLALLYPYVGEGMRPVAAAGLAALAVLFCFNMAGRLFLGDSGSYALSALVGIIAIYTYSHSFDILPADRVALLFSIPVFDTIRLMTTRLIRRRSPFQPDRDHLHHHLAHRWGWPGGLYVYLGLVAVPNLAALAMPQLTISFLVLSGAAYVAAMRLGAGAEEGFHA